MKQKVNFWTDNLEQFKKFVKKEMPGIKDQDLEERFGIPTDLDYVEWTFHDSSHENILVFCFNLF